MITEEKLNRLYRAHADIENAHLSLIHTRYTWLVKASWLLGVKTPGSGAELAVIANNYASSCPKTGGDAKYHKAVTVVLQSWADKCIALDRQIQAAEDKEHSAWNLWWNAKVQREQELTVVELNDVCMGESPLDKAVRGFTQQPVPEWLKTNK